MSDAAQPPRFVPTLTEVIVPETQTPAQDLDNPSAVAINGNLPEPIAMEKIEEAMVQRVLQRVDLILERRLREAVGQVILEHTETLAPRLREEIENLVRQSLNQAFAQEIESVNPTT
jgi:50S ribosomal subunit-associated GTPase HflX